MRAERSTISCLRPFRLCSGRTGMRAFTLIEMMIVVAIIAIIAAVAYPAYQNSILKGKRGEGRAALLDLMQQEERFMTQTGSYMVFPAGSSGNNGTVYSAGGPQSGQSVVFKTYSGDASSAAQANYQLGASACPGFTNSNLNECVQLSAVPNFSDPSVQTLTLQSTGAKGCTGTSPSSCWN